MSNDRVVAFPAPAGERGSAEQRWRRIRGFTHLATVIEGVQCKDGIEGRNDKIEANRDAA